MLQLCIHIHAVSKLNEFQSNFKVVFIQTQNNHAVKGIELEITYLTRNCYQTMVIPANILNKFEHFYYYTTLSELI